MGDHDSLSFHMSDPSMMTTVSLEALQSTKQRQLMDLVDRLRRAGLSTLLQLPQIVVCGDQSSGKSSVLEAITEIPFPRKENLCTRFATEISLRRDKEDSITCKINPHEDRAEEEIGRLREFSRKIMEFDELPALIDEATEVMGLGPLKAFSRDVLSIEICGPDRPQLTLIDLPGLIHSSNKSQSDEDVELIKSLVKDYISKQRTIMLAVVSAKNDYANQIILKMCREFDTKGARTVGIITKPDFLRPNSDNEATWLDLARNKDIFFELGWHLLKNRADDRHSMPFALRNIEERIFFQNGNYRALPQSSMGVEALRHRLSQLLFDHLRSGLPILKDELELMLATTTRQLEALGKSRKSLSEQRIFLAELATSASTIIRMAYEGNYEHPFFGSIDVDAATDEGTNACRLRAVVQYKNIHFERRLRTQGQTFNIAKQNDNEETDNAEADMEFRAMTKRKCNESRKEPKKMTRRQAIKWVNQIQERIRGRELPGVFNPMIIGHIFQQQSANWEKIAREHIDAVSELCKRFVLHVLDSVGTSDVREKLTTSLILPLLKGAHADAIAELGRIMDDKSQHPITYNHYFTDTVQQIQQGRYTTLAQQSTVEVSAKTFTGGSGYENKEYIDPVTFNRGLKKTFQQDMSKFAAEQALDAHDAFYKDERKYFVDAISKQAIERRLLMPLMSIISPKSIAGCSDAQLGQIAAEPPEMIQLRAHLEGKRKMLEDGQEAFQDAIGCM